MPPAIDLHIHSSFSDGVLSPSEIIKQAESLGVIAAALTDHDTTDGIPEFLRYAKNSSLKVITGIELSTFHPLASLHILGYGIDHNSPDLQKALGIIQDNRITRNLAIIQRLTDLGYDISLTELEQHGHGQIGRPHIANLLLRKKIVTSEHEAFCRFLKKDAAAYVPRKPLIAEKAIEIIQQAGGIAVLAHPAIADPTCAFITDLIKTLKEAGLRGIEVFHPAHNKKHLRFFSKICDNLDLIPTGGSDFHGRKKETLTLGRYGKNRLINPELMDNLERQL